MARYLESHEPQLWLWFGSAQAHGEYTESLRLALLKQTYRLDADAHPELAARAAAAGQALGLGCPITLYQASQAVGANAALFFAPGEAHIVLSGPLIATLTPAEMQAVFGHELAHYQLWQHEGGRYLVAERLLAGIAANPRASASHQESARRFRLFTEIFADRGALAAAPDLPTVVAALVKAETGLHEVSGASYLKQADEIFAQSSVKTEGLDHPETFIRARALRLWSEGGTGVDEQVAAMIRGRDRLEELDLLEQVELTETTRSLLEQLLSPPWFRTEATLASARIFFPDFDPAAEEGAAGIDRLAPAARRFPDYFGYLLLDFAVADPDLEDLPLAAAWMWAERLEIGAAFEKIAVRELRLKPRELKRLKQEATTRLAAAGAAGK